MIFALTKDNKKVLKRYTKLWDETKNQIERINSSKSVKYKKDLMKMKFRSDDNLPLGKIFRILVLIIDVNSVSQNDNKYYPQVHVD